MMKGFLISFEGTDGCGKSTQIRLLAEKLKKEGRGVLVSREPGGCRIGEKIREILLDAENRELSPVCELLLYEAARAQHMQQIILPALAKGTIVILDRFIDSTYAYQAHGRGIETSMVESLNAFAVNGRYPDITLLLSLSPKEAFRRKGGRESNDRMEQAGDQFFQRVQNGFEEAARRYPERICVMNVESSKEETHRKIYSRIQTLLGES